MGVLFNRFFQVRFLDKGAVIGGRQYYDGRRIVYPPTIEFSFTHSSESNPNDGEITIINMAPETQRDLLIEGEKIEVEAGYWPQDGSRETGVIFKGQITSAITNYEQTYSKTRILCADSEDAYAHTRVREVFKGKTHKQIADSIATAFKAQGVEIGRIDVPDYAEARPRSVNRLARLELDDICYQHDLQWSIQDGVLNVWPRNEPLENGRKILTPDTGVIGVPEFDDKGVTFKTLMIPTLRPGEVFELQNDRVRARVSEVCKIESIEFSGSNSGSSFGARIKSKFVTGDKVIRSRERFIGAKT